MTPSAPQKTHTSHYMIELKHTEIHRGPSTEGCDLETTKCSFDTAGRSGILFSFELSVGAGYTRVLLQVGPEDLPSILEGIAAAMREKDKPLIPNRLDAALHERGYGEGMELNANREWVPVGRRRHNLTFWLSPEANDLATSRAQALGITFDDYVANLIVREHSNSEASAGSQPVTPKS